MNTRTDLSERGRLRRPLAALGAAVAVLACSSLAGAQTVLVQPGQTQAPPPAPAPVVVQPAQPQPSTQVIQTAPPAATTTAATTESLPHDHWRPNRTLLMTGLVVFGAPYVASVGVAATSSHNGDGNLAIPVLGPWLDMGARGGCPSGSDCGTETGNQVLLAADGILQTIGALEIVGAFVFPEHYEATTITTGKNTSMTLGPSRVGPGAYGLSAIGNF